MSHVFVSYKRQDIERVRVLVTRLREAGMTVYWDEDISPASPWRHDLQQHLDAAACVVVCWTAASVVTPSRYVHDEAARARDRGVLLPLFLDEVTPPLGFGEVQGIFLTDWTGDAADPRFQRLVTSAQALLRGEQPPLPPIPKLRRRLALGGTASAVLFALVAFASDLGGAQQAACRLPGVHAACARLGLGPQLATKDFAAGAMDLSGGSTEPECRVAFFVALMSALRNRSVEGGTVVLGDLTIQGKIKAPPSIVEPPQIALDNGALRALVPVANKKQIAVMPEEVVEKLDIVFHGDVDWR